jgi:GT2 family glycosyltransferase/predicted HAD superfamily hydrolase/Flp pilus assembly protein TadD
MTTPARPLCLASCLLPMDGANCRWWLRIQDELAAQGMDLVLLGHTPPADPRLRMLVLPLWLLGYAETFTAPAGTSTLEPALARALAARDQAWTGQPQRDPAEYQTGLKVCQQVMRAILAELQPSVVLVWGSSVPQSVVLQQAALQQGLPCWALERGLLPETLMLEICGHGGHSELNWSFGLTHALAGDPQADLAAAARKAYFERQMGKYPQSAPEDAAALRQRLGIADRKLVTLLLQHDLASSLGPQNYQGARVHAPGIGTSREAIQALAAAIAQTPGSHLVVKPHPMDMEDYTPLLGERATLCRQVNLHSLMSSSDVIACMTSSSQFEALLCEKPLLLLARSALYGKGVAYEALLREAVPAALSAALQRDQFEARLAAANRFLTFILRHFSIGLSDAMPAGAGLADLARFLNHNAVPPASARQLPERLSSLGGQLRSWLRQPAAAQAASDAPASTPAIDPQLWQKDASLRELGRRLAAKPAATRLITFDFFDTLVCRLCAEPAHLFIELGRQLAQRNLLAHPLSPGEFSSARLAADERAHLVAARRGRPNTARLSDIYSELAPVVTDPAAARNLEFELERTFCYANPAMASFVSYVRSLGYQTAIVSDTYFTAAELSRLLLDNGLSPALFDAVFASCEHGKTKWNGALYPEVLKHFKLAPGAIIHLGDNRQSDCLIPRQLGIEPNYYFKTRPEHDRILEGERALLGVALPAAASLSSLRILTQRQAESDRDAFSDGAMVFGPVLARYADWCVRQFRAQGIHTVLALMREGHLLGELVRRSAAAAGYPLEVKDCYASRISTALAAMPELSAERAAELVEGCVNLTPQDLLQILGLGDEAAQLLDGKTLAQPLPTPDSIRALLQRLFDSPRFRQRLAARQAETRALAAEYFKSLIGTATTVGMLDIGWSGSIQRNLARILRLSGAEFSSVGCYLASTRRAGRLLLEGDTVHAFLDHEWSRTTILPEIAITALVGSTNGYRRNASGQVEPQLGPCQASAEERQTKTRLREGVLAFQSLWLEVRDRKTVQPLSADVLADMDRQSPALFCRLLEYPTRAEADRLGSLRHDENYFGERFSAPLCAPAAADRLRREGVLSLFLSGSCHWPHGLIAQANPRLLSTWRSPWRNLFAAGRLGAWHQGPGADSGLTDEELSSLPQLTSELCPRQIVFAGPATLGLQEALRPLWQGRPADSGTLPVIVTLAPPADADLNPAFLAACKSLTGIAPGPELVQAISAQLDKAANAALVLSNDTPPATAQLLLQELTPHLGAEGVVLTPCGRWDFDTLEEELSQTPQPVQSWHQGSGRRQGFTVWSGSPQTRTSLRNWLVFRRSPANASNVMSPSEASTTTGTGGMPAAARSSASQSAAVTPASAGSPVASILILVLNQLEHTRKCLESITARTPISHEVIVVDNGSTDGTPAYLKEWQAGRPDRIVVRNETNRGFAAGNNQAMALAKGQFLVLLNNDTVVTDGWLESLLNVFPQHPQAGLVGPMSNNVSGPQRVAEVSYRTLEELPAFAAAFAQQHRGQSTEASRAVGFCLAMSRKLLDRIGGLDERFGLGNFEDDDLCIRARLCGFSVRIAHDSFVHHTGSQTFKGASIDYTQAMKKNWEIFRAKWSLPPLSEAGGYVMPQKLPPSTAIRISLPLLQLTHCQEAQAPNRWTQIVAKETPPPAVSRVGNLDAARAHLGNRNFSAAWKAACEAIELRPFHPEAWLLLARIAAESDDAAIARQCAQHAQKLAPGFKAAQQFLQKPLKGHSHPQWAVLPKAPQVSVNGKASPRITVCLITKNEERFIKQCLASIRELAWQIVLVDTGSTDRTVAIAESMDAEIHQFAWCDDFSAARNAALEHARGDYILMLDADEELGADQHEHLLADLAKANAIAWRLPLVNLGKEAEGRSFIPRLFANAPGAYFKGRIHEQIFPSLLSLSAAWGLSSALGTARILHHGYTQELVADRNKIERNLNLLKHAVQEEPANANLVMNLGLELVRSGDLASGVSFYREAFRLMSAQKPEDVVPELREVLLTQLTCQLYKIRAHEEVIDVLSSPLARNGGLTASLHFALGLAYFELKRHEEAAAEMRHCLSRRNQPGLTPINTDTLTAAPYHCLALSLSRLGRVQEAAKAFTDGLEEPIQSPDLALDYARFLNDQKQPVEALQQLHKLVAADAKNAPAWLLGGQIALGNPEFLEFALDWTSEAIQQLPSHAGILSQRGEALLLSRQFDEAREIWQQLHTAEKQPRWLAELIFSELLSGSDLHEPAAPGDVLPVTQAFMEIYRRCLTAQAQEIIQRVNERAALLAPVLPDASRILQSIAAQAAAKG